MATHRTMGSAVTQVKPAHDRQRIEAACLDALLSTVDRGILVEDRRRRVVAVNAALGELFGVPVDPAELAGSRLADRVPGDGDEAESWARLVRAVRDPREDAVPVHLP